MLLYRSIAKIRVKEKYFERNGFDDYLKDFT